MGPPTGVTGRGESKSPKPKPKQSSKPSSPPRQSASQSDTKRDSSKKADDSINVEPAKPLAPPPRPTQQQGSDSPDYFTNPVGGSLSLEPNPFEQSFGGAPPETPGGTKLPSVAALTSPSSLLPGNTPFAWGGGSLRTGPLSPAMLSAPTNDYFSDTHHIRGGFPTPNESSLRTGLTPGGSGSMFPAPSPSQALFAQLTGPSATPGTIDFHRTALSAAAKREAQAQQPAIPPTSQPAETANGVQPESDQKAPSGRFDPHDNDAANGLFMLAQGRNGTQSTTQQFPTVPPAQVTVSTAPAVQPVSASVAMNNGAPSATSGSIRGVSEVSVGSDQSEVARPKTRSRGKAGEVTGSRRKAEELPAKTPSRKKSKSNGGAPVLNGDDFDHSDDDEEDHHDKSGEEKGSGSKSKMTEEEKRKNFLERNRVAALKCRQRKKQWLANLQTKVEVFSQENENLTTQITALREEVVNLKTLLLAHKDCPITQQQGIHGGFMPQPPTMDQFQAPMNPYGMPPAMPTQPVMAGQAMNRRYS